MAKLIDTGEQYEVEIEDVGNGGQGIGRIEGMAVFIPGAVTGDVVLAEITGLKKSYALGEIVNIVKPSPIRIEAKCQYFGRCGGCQLQHVDYSAQLVIKKKWVFDRLVRIGGLDNPNVAEIIGMEEPWLYRNKVQYGIGRLTGRDKKTLGCKIGFNKAMSHEIIDCESCLLQGGPADYIAEAVREYVKETKIPIYDGGTNTGVLRQIIVKTAFGTGEIMVVVVAAERRLPDVELLLEKLQGAVDLANAAGDGDDIVSSPYRLRSLILNVNKKRNGPIMGKESITLAGSPTIKDRLMEMNFEISSQSYYQINPLQTEKLYEKVREYAGLTGKETVFDLYCGVGTIGLILAKDAAKVIGIESVKPAVIDANRNATINGIVNAEFITGKAEDALPKLIEEGARADLIILDPPRSGCDPQLLESVVLAEPDKIIYVSCDPATLARDIKILADRGYRLVEAQPVDMFPHTGNTEIAALLKKI
jgi:23S rRNA (uracil1939-C5)-methyltransferase